MTDDTGRPAAPDDDEYEQMLLLEDLESLAEEMDEVGVTDLAEVRRWLAVGAADAEAGVPGAADRAGLEAIARPDGRSRRHLAGRTCHPHPRPARADGLDGRVLSDEWSVVGGRVAVPLTASHRRNPVRQNAALIAQR